MVEDIIGATVLGVQDLVGVVFSDESEGSESDQEMDSETDSEL